MDLWTTISKLLWEEKAQDTFEYLLVVGAFAVVLVLTLSAGFSAIVQRIFKQMCSAVDPLGSGSDCTG